MWSRSCGLRSPRRSKRPRWHGTLDSVGRETSRAALRHIMSESRAAGLIDGRPADLPAQFAGFLWRDLMIYPLLGVAEPPTPARWKHGLAMLRRCLFVYTRHSECHGLPGRMALDDRPPTPLGNSDLRGHARSLTASSRELLATSSAAQCRIATRFWARRFTAS
jgi:hypothetical protein